MLRMQIAAAVLLATPFLPSASAVVLPAASASTSFSPTARNIKLPISIDNNLGYIGKSPTAANSPTIAANPIAMPVPYFDLLVRRESKFTLWIPGQAASHGDPPKLILGKVDKSSSPATFKQLYSGALSQSDKTDLFELDPNTIAPALQDGAVYWYWFEVTDTSAKVNQCFPYNDLDNLLGISGKYPGKSCQEVIDAALHFNDTNRNAIDDQPHSRHGPNGTYC